MRTAQPTVLEVPVTVQGSKSVEGTDQRELFTETTKTVLVFENGAVMNLKSRLSPTQTVFLRNEQSGREILCRVVESPAAGKVGPTDLEFTVYDPEFWVVKAEAPAAAAPKSPSATPETVAPAETVAPPETAAPAETAKQETPNPDSPKPVEPAEPVPVAARTVEEIVPAYEPVVPAVSEAAPAASDVPTPALETTEAKSAAVDEALPEPAKAEASPEPADTEAVRQRVAEAESSDAEAEDRLAALMALEANKTAMRAAAKKEKEARPAAAPGDPQSGSERDPGEATHIEEFSTEEVPTRAIFNSALTQNPIVMGIAASVLIMVVVGIAWHARRGSSNRAATGDRAAAASLKSSQNDAGAAAQSPQAPGSNLSAGGSTAAHAGNENAGTTTGTAGQRIQQPGVSPKAELRATRGGSAGENSGGPLVTESAGNGSMRNSDEAVLSRDRRSSQPNPRGIIPAKIVTQPQPAIPAWAKALDLDGVVTLDATIDEKGNVTKTKVLSGPRVLQRAAQDAVALWIFEPAQNSGKPIVSHIVLTVEFQR